jgi:anti-sigma-K factor RskA
MTAHEIHALSGAYAVDALDDLERARFEEHLAVCAECQAEVSSLQDAAALFAATTAVAPSSAMRDKILADIKTVRPLPPLVARLEAPRPRRWATRLVAAAAVLGIAGGGISLWQQTHDDAAPVVADAASQIMNAADVKTVSKDIGNGTTVKVYRSQKLGRAAIKTVGLPKAPSGKVYELWLRNAAGSMVKAGFLTGSGTRKVAFDGDASWSTGAGISVEPAGGSDQPTLLYAIVPFKQST